LAGAAETAAQTHAVLRAQGGFDINQLVSEYRALRASVLRLWIDANSFEDPDAEELIRFNEAIDQAIAESVGHFHAKMEQARNLLLGMLGHDMRTPLNSIVTTASYLAQLNAGAEVSSAAQGLIRSGASMRVLLDDLVDFNRTKLGLGIKIAPSDIDLSAELADELEQLRDAHPNRQIELEVSGECRGRWDGPRLKQVVRNLVGNAVQHGPPDTPVHVILGTDETEARLEVIDYGSTIDPSVQSVQFDPLKPRLGKTAGEGKQDGLGLGLFIVREIVRAHGGKVELDSNGGKTVFAVRLPHQEASLSV
jgi:signal transduction histidine kinase